MSRLPETLTNEKIKELIERMQNGDQEARELLINHNLRLIQSLINKYYYAYYDKEELFLIGQIGLIKGIDTYDTEKSKSISTYLSKCILNEIGMFFRKENRRIKDVSLSESVYRDNTSDDTITFEEQLATDEDLVDDYEYKETIILIREAVENLPEPRKTAVKMKFGFYNDKCYTQREIAAKLGLSQSYVSRIVTKSLMIIKSEMEKLNAMKVYQNLNKKPKNTLDNKQPKKSKIRGRDSKDLYSFFEAPKEKVNMVIEGLSDFHKQILIKKYGPNFNNPQNGVLTNEERRILYCNIISMIKRRLNPQKRSYKPKSIYELLDYPKEQVDLAIDYLSPKEREIIFRQYGNNLANPTMTALEGKDYQAFYNIVRKMKSQLANGITPSQVERKTNIFHTKVFKQLIGVLTIEEAIIFLLKYGYINGREYSNEEIKEVLSISENRLNKIITKLIPAKENIMSFINELNKEQTLSGSIQLVKE